MKKHILYYNGLVKRYNKYQRKLDNANQNSFHRSRVAKPIKKPPLVRLHQCQLLSGFCYSTSGFWFFDSANKGLKLRVKCLKMLKHNSFVAIPCPLERNSK